MTDYEAIRNESDLLIIGQHVFPTLLARSFMDSTSASDPKDVIGEKSESQSTDKPSETNPIPGLYEDGILDPIYQEKTKILNRAIEEIGMGRYQVRCLILFELLMRCLMKISTFYLSLQDSGILRTSSDSDPFFFAS